MRTQQFKSCQHSALYSAFPCYWAYWLNNPSLSFSSTNAAIKPSTPSPTCVYGCCRGGGVNDRCCSQWWRRQRWRRHASPAERGNDHEARFNRPKAEAGKAGSQECCSWRDLGVVDAFVHRFVFGNTYVSKSSYFTRPPSRSRRFAVELVHTGAACLDGARTALCGTKAVLGKRVRAIFLAPRAAA